MTTGFSSSSFSLNKFAMLGASALFAASLFVALPALVNASASNPAEKADLADAQDCELRNWPYYARGCLRDDSRNAGRAVKARIVTTDRIGLNAPAASAAGDSRSDEVSATSRTGHSPAYWTGMTQGDVQVYLSAGDFIRRTVR